MARREQLPYLLQLLDDDSPVVQEAVKRELAAFGSELDTQLQRLDFDLDAVQRERLDEVRQAQRRKYLKAQWHSWFYLETDAEKLERAFNLLSQFQAGPLREQTLTQLLDELAEEFRESDRNATSDELSSFLFDEKEFEGARTDYYSPQNSDLVYVIENRRGIPISLACIYILVGQRLGIPVQGCNFPGHFLARTTLNGVEMLVDCFNGGRMIEAGAFLNLNPGSATTVEEYVCTETNAEMIIGRVLNNLANAYKLAHDEVHSDFMMELLYILQTEAPQS